MSPYRACLVAPLLLALAACATAQPPPASAPAGAAAPASAPAGSPAAADEPPSARVTDVEAQGAGSGRAKVLFSNPGKRACKVSGYKLVWTGKPKAINVKEFDLPPGETRERWIRIDRDDGDLATLDPEKAKIELTAACGP